MRRHSHAFYDDMVASYSGPNLGTRSTPYGVARDTFKFAYGIDALVAWMGDADRSRAANPRIPAGRCCVPRRRTRSAPGA